MSKKEREKLLGIIEDLSQSIKKDNEKYVKQEYRQAFQIGQLDALLMIRESIEYDIN